MLWIMLAVFCISAVTFMMIKTHAGMKAFVSAKGAWTLSHTKAKYALDDFLESNNPADFDQYKKYINTCRAIRQSRTYFDQGEFQKGIKLLEQSQINPNNIPDIVFTYRYFSWIPEVKQITKIWGHANQMVYEYDSIAELIKKAQSNQVDQQIIIDQTSHLNRIYKRILPLENQLDNSIHKLTAWVGNMSFWITAVIYVMMGLLLYLGIKRTMNAFHERDALYHATFHHSNLGIIQIGINGTIQRMNQAFCDIFSVLPTDMRGRQVKDILIKHNNQPPQDNDVFKELNSDDPVFSYIFNIKNRKKQLMWLKAITKVFNQQNTPLYYIAMIEDITELHGVNEQLKQMAHHDYLTGLSNKFSFDNKLTEAVSNKQYGVLFCMDLDKFKNINDTAGHAAGDHALVEIAHILRLSFKKDDVIARIGGDEFAAFVSNIDMTVANTIKAGITKAVEQHLITFENHSFHLGISIGTAALSDDIISSKQLMLQADTAAYEAKSQRSKG